MEEWVEHLLFQNSEQMMREEAISVSLKFEEAKTKIKSSEDEVQRLTKNLEDLQEKHLTMKSEFEQQESNLKKTINEKSKIIEKQKIDFEDLVQ